MSHEPSRHRRHRLAGGGAVADPRGLHLISHDRAFLRRLARATLWLDRGVVRRMDRPFERFEDWRDEIWAQEDLARHKLDRKIKEEARWAVEGISARRKRNQGRVRELRGCVRPAPR
jgi:ATP-binding cassette subfamily F protein uup